MKKTKLGYILVTLATTFACFTACDPSSDYHAPNTSAYNSCERVAVLSSFQKEFGGYKLKDKIPFKHSDGFDFIATVTKEINDANDYTCEVTRDVWLTADYPAITIKLNTAASSISNTIDSYTATIGQHQFTLRDLTDTTFRDTLIDSLKVNKNTYYNLGVATDKGNLKSDSKIYYNNKYGIIKITLEDGSSITLNDREGY